MAKFSIIVTRDVTESIMIEIEAHDEEAAVAFFDDLHSDCGEIEKLAAKNSAWAVDDASCQSGDVYITSIGEG